MNKKFTLSLFVLLLLVIGLPSAFAQTIIQGLTARTDSSLLIQAKLLNTPFGGPSVFGYDTTTYTGLTTSSTAYGTIGGFKIPTKNSSGIRQLGSRNIAPNAVPTDAQYFLKFSDVGGSTGFRFGVGDTIFLSFNSKNSGDRRRFKFDTVNKTLSFFVNNQGGSGNLEFKIIGKDGQLSTDAVTNNTGTISNYNASIDTLRILITDIPSSSPNGTEIYLYNLYVAPADSFLQGRVFGVEDTLVVNYGKYNGLRKPVDVLRGNGYWEYRPYNTCYLSTYGSYVGGAPLVKFRLLPGDASFVRWNVGVYPTNNNIWNPTYTLRADGSLDPTTRRDHHRGRITGGTWAPFRITDTTSIFNVGPVSKLPDTLYVFDPDSNFVMDSVLFTKTTLIGIDSLSGEQINRNSGCGTLYGVKIYNYDEKPGRISFNWGYEIVDDTSRIRLAAIFNNTLRDTLNSKYLEKDPTNGSFAISSTKKSWPNDTTINIIPGLPEKIAATYNIGGGWKVFPDSMNYNQLPSRVDLKVTLRDKCNNRVLEGAVGSYATNVILSRWDTTIQQGVYVWGPEPNNKFRTSYPLTDTLFVYSRKSDLGEVIFSWKPENCLKGTISFNFLAYADSIPATIVAGPVKKLENYWLKIYPDNTPKQVRLVSSVKPTRIYYPTGDTSRVQTVDNNCNRTILPIKAYFLNACGDVITGTADTNWVTFQSPSVRDAADTNNSYNPTWDKLGSYTFHTGTTYKYISGSDGAVYIDYQVPKTKGVRTRIIAYLTGTPTETDEHYVETYSGNPAKLMVSTGTRDSILRVRDSILIASRGFFDPIKSSKTVYAALRDCQGEPYDAGVAGLGTGTLNVTWTLYGPASGSASLFDPAPTSPGSIPYYTLNAANPSFNPLAPATVPRGTRSISFTNTNGTVPYTYYGKAQQDNAVFVGINSDTVGGKGITKDLVFPVEKDRVFPSGTYTGDFVTKYYDENNNLVSIPSNMPSYRGYNILKVTGTYTIGTTVYNLTQSLDNTVFKSTRVDFFTVPDTINQVAWVDGTGLKFASSDIDNSFMAPVYNVKNLYGRQAAPILDWASTVTPQYKRLIIDTQNKSNTVTPGINSWTGGRNYAGNFVDLYVRLYDMFGNPIDVPDTAQVDIKVVNRKLANPTSIAYNFGETGYLNGRFVKSGSLTNANYGTPSAENDKTIITTATSNLKGALKVQYQTTFANNRSSYIDVNQADTVRFVAVVNSGGGSTFSDTGIVRSMPTNNLANYQLINPNYPAKNAKRVGDTLSYRWMAIDDNSAQLTSNPHALPKNARLWWYDYRVFGDTLSNQMALENPNYTVANPAISNTAVWVVANANTYSPILTLYPGITTDPSTHPLTGQVWVRTDSTPTVKPSLSGVGFDTLSTPQTYTSPFNTFTVVSKSKVTVGSGKNDNITATYWNGLGGFVLGEGRFDFTMHKAATYRFSILDSASLSVVGDPTPAFTWLPGPIHWVSMVNPNAARPELEAVYPYPIRKNYSGLINFPGTSTGDTWNENWPAGANPRSYATPVDTIFIGQHYNLELRTYDRYGNRNTDDSIYVSVETTPGFWKNSFQGSGFTGEVLLDQDTTGKSIENVYDLLQTIPTTDNTAEFAAKVRINYNPVNGMNTAVSNKPALPPSNAAILAFRDVYVKTLKAPGAFSITNTGANLVRLDDGDFTAMWEEAKSTNLYEDSIKYTWYIKDLADATVATVNVGYGATSKTLTPAEMAAALGLGPKNYNRTVKWYVVATNKWGLSTQSSNTVTTIFELNKKPETFALTSPGLPNDTKLVNSTATPLTLGWNVPVDSNGASDGVNTTSVTSYGQTYTLDTLTYKLVLTKVSDFPAGTGYTGATWEKVSTVGNAITIPVDTLKKLLGTADSVLYTWQVFAKDRNAADWSATDFVRASNVLNLKLTKIGTLAKILVGATQNSTNPLYKFPVTDSVTFTLNAYDGDMNLIRGFNNFGVNLKLVAEGAKTSTVPEQKITLLNLNTGAYLAGDITSGFTLPSSAFVNGVATLSYRNTKAGDTVQIAVPDANPTFKMIEEGNEVTGMLLITGDKTRKYLTTPGAVAKLKVEVMPRTGTNVVYKNRAMEVVVTPTDVYKNEIVTLPDIAVIKISAKYSDNFVGTAWSGERLITGKSSYILTPSQAQNDQVLYAYLADNYGSLGQTAPFQILDHAPSAFTLVSPANNAIISLTGHSQRTKFEWTVSTDPCNAPLIKSVPNAQGQYEKVEDADVITYSLVLSGNNTNYTLPDSSDKDVILNATGTQLFNALKSIGGSSDQKKVVVTWKVIATDGLYQTISDSRTLTLQNDGINAVEDNKVIPTKFDVGQNYPNPFNPTTNIRYELPKVADVKVVIYNILGQPVRTLVNAKQEAGVYTITWDGKNDLGMPVSSGTYIYRVTAGEFSATKKMNLLK
ncbi:MAG TPA: FlgD immunoglobulin-like domain containing protein [Candidatus Cloacimonas sp.]|nr:FlgD immunoglobulin-like domain containing protein [Candidatus Cloacimonas sp.]